MTQTTSVVSSKGLDKKIVAALRDALGEGNFPLHEPRFMGNEGLYARECIESTFVSSVGKYVDRFERDLAEITGVRRAVALVNGTAALQVGLRLAGVKSGDEVLVPALTFVATANAVCYLGAVPHFADSSSQTLGLDPVSLKNWLNWIAERTPNGTFNRITGRRIQAMVPMHTFGHPCDLEGLLAVAEDYHLSVVEDAAEALGSHYKGRHLGAFGLLGVLSFNGNKIITTGGGGAILTNNERLADYAKHLTTTAKRQHRWDFFHDEVGYNFRMPNLNAALGCAQLEQLSTFLASKRRLTEKYSRAFSSLPAVKLMKEPEGCRSNYWLQTLLLDESVSDQRNDVLNATNDAGFMTRPAWQLMHHLPAYMHAPRAPTPIAESLAKRIINLPSSAGIV